MNAWAIVPDHLLLALGWTLVHFLWQGALVAALFAIAARAFDRNAAGPRYALAASALLVMALLPAATFVKLAGEFADVPPVAVVAMQSEATGDFGAVAIEAAAGRAAAATHVDAGPRHVRSTVAAADTDERADARAASPGSPAPEDTRLAFAREAFGDVAPAAGSSFWLAARTAGATVLRMLAAAAAGGLERGAPLWLPWLVALWGLGVSLLTLRLAGGWVIAQRLKRAVIEGPVDRLQQAVERLGVRLGVSRPVRVFRSALVEVPTVIGWLRPVVLVPVGAVTGLTPAQLEALLAHELAHIRRHDYLVNLLQTVVETLLFYHPAVWWVSRRVREEREHCCDDLAVAACGDRVAYARALCELERMRLPAPGLAMAASGGSLLHRIRRLLHPAPPVSLASRCGACLTVIGSLMVVLLGLAPAAMKERAARADEGALAVPAGFADAPQAPAAPDPAWSLRMTPAPPAPPLRTPARVEWVPVAPLAPVPAPAPFVHPAPVTDPAPAPSPAPAPAVALPDYGVIAALAERARELGRDVERETRRAVAHMMRKDLSLSVSPTVEATAITAPRAAAGFWARAHEAKRAAYRDAVSRVADFDADEDQLASMMAQGIEPGYVRDMAAALGDTPGGEELLGLYVTGVTPDYVRAMRRMLGGAADAEELMAFRTHGVTPEYAREMTLVLGQELDADDLVGFRVHGVTPEYVHTMRQVVDGPVDADDLIGFRVHGIEPDYAREVAERMGGRIDGDDLIEMKVQNVTPRQLDALRRIGVGPGDEGLVELRSHGISLGYVAQMRHFRGHDLTLDQLVSLHEHGIEPEAVGAMNVLGYRSLSVDDLVRLAENGWTVEGVAQFTSAFGRTLTVDELVTLQDNGVNVVYAGNMAHLRGASFGVEDIVAFHQHGVPSSWIAAVLDTDYRHRGVEDLLLLADHGVESRYLSGLVKAGHGALEPAEVVQLHDAGVAVDCIERAGRRMSPDELIRRCNGEDGDCAEKR